MNMFWQFWSTLYVKAMQRKATFTLALLEATWVLLVIEPKSVESEPLCDQFKRNIIYNTSK